MYLMLAMHMIAIVQANPRRHLHELSVKAVGDVCRVRGGVGRFDLRRTQHDIVKAQLEDQEMLKADGFNMGGIYRERQTCWSYNCQMANMSRLRQWSEELTKCFVLLQGTSRTFDQTKGERSLSQWQTDDHDIVEAKVAKKLKARGPQPEGVLFMGPKGVMKLCRKIMVPNDPELQGRAIAVWIARGPFDICFVSMYCPLGDRDVQNQKRTEKLWNWMRMIKTIVPPRTMTIIGVDANGHVRSVRERTTECKYHDGGDGEDGWSWHAGSGDKNLRSSRALDLTQDSRCQNIDIAGVCKAANKL